jgi:glycosyltransferase involved in cell wall biosynthesis
MSRKPLVSIIVNCFNGEKYLREALDGVIAQTYTHWELIFWDNKSTDSSRAIFDSYHDSRFKYFLADSHTVLYAARNGAIAHCKGDFICFLDVDDWWSAEHISRQVHLFDSPQVVIVCGNFWVVNELTGRRKIRFRKVPPTGLVLDALLSNYFVGLVTLMIRKSALEGLSYIFNDRYHIIGEFDLVLRLATTSYLDFDNKPTAFYRVHGQNETTRHRGLQVEELEHWRKTTAIQEAISQSKRFPLFEEFILYKRGMFQALHGNRTNVLENANMLPWGRQKFILLLTLVLPHPLLRWVGNRV